MGGVPVLEPGLQRSLAAALGALAASRLERALLVWSGVGPAAWSGLFTTWVWAG
jgi:hypothetical protein